MVPPIDPRAFLALLELTLAQTYELQAMRELLEEKGWLTRADILKKATALKAAAEGVTTSDLIPATHHTDQDISQTTH